MRNGNFFEISWYMTHTKRVNIIQFTLAFPTGRDSATFRDKGTTGQAQNLSTGRDFDSLSRPGTSRGTKQLSILYNNGSKQIRLQP